MASPAHGRIAWPRILRAAFMLLPLLVLLDVASLWVAVLRGPFPSSVPLGTPLAYRNLYVHVPVALASYALFIAAAAAAAVHLARGSRLAARLAAAYAVLGALYAAATLATGSAWASESWGSYWNWDPKQTAVLLLFLAYAAVLPLRRSIPDPERRDRVTSIYVMAALSLVPIAFLSSRLLASLHPTAEAAGQFSNVGGPLAAALFLGRSLLVSLEALMAGALIASGSRPRWAGALAVAVILAGLALALVTLAPSLPGGVARVADAVVEGGGVKELVLSDGRVVEFREPVRSPVKPPVLPDGRPTLIGHLVRVEGDRIVVVYHWSTPFSVALYTAILAAALTLLYRGWRP